MNPGNASCRTADRRTDGLAAAAPWPPSFFTLSDNRSPKCFIHSGARRLGIGGTIPTRNSSAQQWWRADRSAFGLPRAPRHFPPTWLRPAAVIFNLRDLPHSDSFSRKGGRAHRIGAPLLSAPGSACRVCLSLLVLLLPSVSR